MKNVYPLKCHISNDAGVTRVDVYDDIGGGSWFSQGVSAADFATTMAGVKGALEVHINSGGGNVFDGIAIKNAISGHKGKVTTVVDGLAASIASVIAQAGAERVMTNGSMLMIHDAYSALEGNSAEMAKMAATLDQVSDNLAAVYAARAGGAPSEWRDRMRDETWFTAEEAVAAGLADRVAGVGAAIPAGLDLAAFAMPGRIAAQLRSLPKISGAAAPADASCAELGHQCCRDAMSASALLRSIVRDELRSASGNAGWVQRDGSWVFDPDGDGDDDSTAEGDTDHDYFDTDGTQIEAIPPNPATGKGGKPMAPSGRAVDAFYAADKYTQADRDEMAKSGEAMEDGSYPIRDSEDLSNAIRAVGRGGADHDSIRRHVIKRAAALKLSSEIPDNWNSDGSLNTSAGDSLAAQFLALVDRTAPARAGKE